MTKITKEKIVVSTDDFNLSNVEQTIKRGEGSTISPEKLIGSLYEVQYRVKRFKDLENAIKRQIETKSFDQILDTFEKEGKISPGATPEIELNIKNAKGGVIKRIKISIGEKDDSSYEISECIYEKEVFDFLPDKYKIFKDPELNRKALIADFKDGSIPDSIGSYIKETKSEKVALRGLEQKITLK